MILRLKYSGNTQLLWIWVRSSTKLWLRLGLNSDCLRTFVNVLSGKIGKRAHIEWKEHRLPNNCPPDVKKEESHLEWYNSCVFPYI